MQTPTPVQAPTPAIAPDVRAISFISYAHSDAIIAETLERELKSLCRDQLACFLDTKSIPAGARWRPILEEWVQKSDFLLVVYTGDQSAYVGFEIGKFSGRDKIFPNWESESGRIQSGDPIVCLHDVQRKDLPALFNEYNSVRVIEPDPTLVAGSVEEKQFWLSTPMANFLIGLCQFRDLYRPPADPRIADGYNEQIARAAKGITEAFVIAKNSDVITREPCQAELEISLSLLDRTAVSIPDSCSVMADSSTWELFGLNVPLNENQKRQLTWGEMSQRLIEPPRKYVPWMDKVSRDVMKVLKDEKLYSDEKDVTFTVKRAVFRAIVSRQEISRNKTRRVAVQFVETLNRRLPGKRNTSGILAALFLSSQYYFRFQEDRAIQLAKFDVDLTPDEFQVSCRQFLQDLERIEHEGMEHGLADTEGLISVLGPDHAEEARDYFKSWETWKMQLLEDLKEPLPTETKEGRELLRTKIVGFIDATNAKNSRFLPLAVDLYQQAISGVLASSARQGQRSKTRAVVAKGDSTKGRLANGTKRRKSKSE